MVHEIVYGASFNDDLNVQSRMKCRYRLAAIHDQSWLEQGKEAFSNLATMPMSKRLRTLTTRTRRVRPFCYEHGKQ